MLLFEKLKAFVVYFYNNQSCHKKKSTNFHNQIKIPYFCAATAKKPDLFALRVERIRVGQLRIGFRISKKIQYRIGPDRQLTKLHENTVLSWR